MAEVLPFECEHEEECRANGIVIPDECPDYCGLYREKRAEAIEEIALDMLGCFRQAVQCDDFHLFMRPYVCDNYQAFEARLKEWGAL